MEFKVARHKLAVQAHVPALCCKIEVNIEAAPAFRNLHREGDALQPIIGREISILVDEEDNGHIGRNVLPCSPHHFKLIRNPDVGLSVVKFMEDRGFAYLQRLRPIEDLVALHGGRTGSVYLPTSLASHTARHGAAEFKGFGEGKFKNGPGVRGKR